MKFRILAALPALFLVGLAHAQVIDIKNPNIVITHGGGVGGTEEPVLLQWEGFGPWVNGYTPLTRQTIDIFTWSPQMLAIRNNRVVSFFPEEPIPFITFWASDYTQNFTKFQFTVTPIGSGPADLYFVIDMPGGPLQDHVERIHIDNIAGPQTFTVEAINGFRIDMVRFEPNFTFDSCYNIGVSGLTPAG